MNNFNWTELLVQTVTESPRRHTENFIKIGGTVQDEFVHKHMHRRNIYIYIYIKIFYNHCSNNQLFRNQYKVNLVVRLKKHIVLLSPNLMRCVLTQALQERGFKLFRYFNVKGLIACALLQTARAPWFDSLFILAFFLEI